MVVRWSLVGTIRFNAPILLWYFVYSVLSIKRDEMFYTYHMTFIHIYIEHLGVILVTYKIMVTTSVHMIFIWRKICGHCLNINIYIVNHITKCLKRDA